MKVKPLYWSSDQDFVLTTMGVMVQAFAMHVEV